MNLIPEVNRPDEVFKKVSPKTWSRAYALATDICYLSLIWSSDNTCPIDSSKHLLQSWLILNFNTFCKHNSPIFIYDRENIWIFKLFIVF